MSLTNIEWADRVWNPVTGCSKVSQGCKNCYAEGVANRFFASQYPSVVDLEAQDKHGNADCPVLDPDCEGRDGDCHDACEAPLRARRFTDVQVHPERLLEVRRWSKPARVFVNSMSDLFHEAVPAPFIMQVFDFMEASPQHTFLVLTKRPRRMLDVLGGSSGAGLEAPALPNVHLGVSVEDQATADERIPLLMQVPAAVRWVSYEPALGPVDFSAALREPVLAGRDSDRDPDREPWLDWIVVGGESGHGARPFDIEWARSVLGQGALAGVPIFVKQLGARPFSSDPMSAAEVELLRALSARQRGRGAAGNPAEWPEDLRVRELPRAVAA